MHPLVAPRDFSRWKLRKDVGSLDVFGKDAQGDDSGGDSIEEGRLENEPHRPGETGLCCAADDAANESVLDENLHVLHESRGAKPTFLYRFQVCGFDRAMVSKKGNESIGGSNGVLNGKVDADASDRRHGMSGVADTQEAGAIPSLESINRDGQESDLIPISESFESVPDERCDGGDAPSKGLDTLLAKLFVSPLGNDESALPIVTSIDHDQHFALVETSQQFPGVIFLSRDAHPQDVDRAPMSSMGRAACRRKVECRPSDPIVSSARTSRSPLGDFARTPWTIPFSSMRSVASVDMRR